jgi:uncharacterized protein (TIGR02246 family)
MPLWSLLLIIVLAIAIVGMGAYFSLLRPRVRRQEVFAVPEFEVPRIVPGHWREMKSEETPEERQLPRRLTLTDLTEGAKIVREFVAALHERDLDRVLSMYAEDADLVAPDGTYKGKEEIKRYWTWVFETNSALTFTDSGIGIMVQGNKAVYEHLVSGTTKGIKWQRPTLGVYEFNEGRVQHHRMVYDRLVPVKQAARGRLARTIVNSIAKRVGKGLR